MSELESILRQVTALPPPARLRLAANLMDEQRGDLAHAIAAPVIEELGAALALRALERRGGTL